MEINITKYKWFSNIIFMNDIKKMTPLDALWKNYVILINVTETIIQGQFANIHEGPYTAMRLNKMQFLFVFWVIIENRHWYFCIKIYLILKLFQFLSKDYNVLFNCFINHGYNVSVKPREVCSQTNGAQLLKLFHCTVICFVSLMHYR